MASSIRVASLPCWVGGCRSGLLALVPPYSPRKHIIVASSEHYYCCRQTAMAASCSVLLLPAYGNNGRATKLHIRGLAPKNRAAPSNVDTYGHTHRPEAIDGKFSSYYPFLPCFVQLCKRVKECYYFLAPRATMHVCLLAWWHMHGSAIPRNERHKVLGKT